MGTSKSFVYWSTTKTKLCPNPADLDCELALECTRKWIQFEGQPENNQNGNKWCYFHQICDPSLRTSEPEPARVLHTSTDKVWHWSLVCMVEWHLKGRTGRFWRNTEHFVGGRTSKSWETESKTSDHSSRCHQSSKFQKSNLSIRDQIEYRKTNALDQRLLPAHKVRETFHRGADSPSRPSKDRKVGPRT